jgi:tripartite-type tricarboxylate transporter receptor subunit TctC
MRKRTQFTMAVIVSFLICFMTLGSGVLAADSFPAKDINFTVGYSAGGGTDLITRALAQPIEDLAGVKVVVSNLPGASGGILAQKIASGEPAYNLGLYSKTLVLIQYTGFGKININQFTPVAQVAEDTAALSVPSDAQYNDLKGFIAYAKANPGKIRIGNGGTGGLWHLAAVLFGKAAGIEVDHIPYKGGRPALIATAGHEIEAVIANPAETRALVETGDIKVIAVMSGERNPAYPDVPTAIEQGLDFTFPVWRGIFTAAGGPPENIDKIAGIIKKSMESPEFVKFMKNSGTPIKYRGPADFAQLVENENKLYSELLGELGLKVTEPPK